MRGSCFCSIIVAALLGLLLPAQSWPLQAEPQPPGVTAAGATAGSGRGVLLASMENSKHYISYGSDSFADGTQTPGSHGKRETPSIQEKKGYIEYRSGPTRDQTDQLRQQEEENRARSWEMLQNLFIDLPSRSRGRRDTSPQIPPSGK